MNKYEKEADRVMQRDKKRIVKFAREADQEIEQLKKENEMLKARLNAINDNCYDADLVGDLSYVDEV